MERLVRGSVGAWCKQERVFFFLLFKLVQGRALGASKLAPTWEFCAKKEDGEGVLLRLKGGERNIELIAMP